MFAFQLVLGIDSQFSFLEFFTWWDWLKKCCVAEESVFRLKSLTLLQQSLHLTLGKLLVFSVLKVSAKDLVCCSASDHSWCNHTVKVWLDQRYFSVMSLGLRDKFGAFDSLKILLGLILFYLKSIHEPLRILILLNWRFTFRVSLFTVFIYLKSFSVCLLLTLIVFVQCVDLFLQLVWFQREKGLIARCIEVKRDSWHVIHKGTGFWLIGFLLSLLAVQSK